MCFIWRFSKKILYKEFRAREVFHHCVCLSSEDKTQQHLSNEKRCGMQFLTLIWHRFFNNEGVGKRVFCSYGLRIIVRYVRVKNFLCFFWGFCCVNPGQSFHKLLLLENLVTEQYNTIAKGAGEQTTDLYTLYSRSLALSSVQRIFFPFVSSFTCPHQLTFHGGTHSGFPPAEEKWRIAPAKKPV